MSQLQRMVAARGLVRGESSGSVGGSAAISSIVAVVHQGAAMSDRLDVNFTGLRFPNPFLLSSAPPTESDANIMRAFDAGWRGVVTKTIGLHPVVNVDGPKTKFLRASTDGHLSMQKRPGTALHSSWNWELISDKPLDWWIPRISRIKKAYPDRILVASIMAGSGSDREL